MALVAVDLAAGYYTNKRGKKRASQFFVAAAGGVVSTDVYELLTSMGYMLSRPSGSMSYGNSVMGKYGRTAPVSGYGSVKPIGWAYPRR